MSDRPTPHEWRRHPDCWKMEALHWHRLCVLKDQAMESHQLVNKADLDDAEAKLAEARVALTYIGHNYTQDKAHIRAKVIEALARIDANAESIHPESKP